MNIYYASIIAAAISFSIYLLYYKVLFHEAMEIEAKKTHSKRPETSYITWIIIAINLIITSFIFSTFGYTFKIFVTAPKATPYILAAFLWFIITAALINSSARTKSSQIATFLHSGFWLVTFIIYAYTFPLLLSS